MKILHQQYQKIQWLEFETWEEIVSKIELKYFENPVNDAQKLFNAQKKFIESKFTDSGAESVLYTVSELVCCRLIKKELKQRKYTFYSADEIRDKAAVATDYFVRRYRTNWYKNHQIYYIKEGFIRVLQDACRYPLDYLDKYDFLDKSKKLGEKLTYADVPEEYADNLGNIEKYFGYLMNLEEKEKTKEKENDDEQ